MDVYGSIHERPTVASVKAAREMLPSDEQVDNIKKQFKDRRTKQVFHSPASLPAQIIGVECGESFFPRVNHAVSVEKQHSPSCLRSISLPNFRKLDFSQELDLNNDGTLSFNEMQKMMQGIAPSMSEIQLQKLFCAADVKLVGFCTSSSSGLLSW